jgi:sugar phosphate permease
VLVILLSMPYVFLLPGFVASALHRGPEVLGMLLSMTGIGALGGALVVASLPPRRRGLLYLLSALLQGVMLTVFSFSPWLWLTTPVMIVMGIGQAGRQSFSNVLAQSYAADEYRGRVMSVYMLQFNLTRIGTFIVGILAATFGARLALGGTSLLMVAGVLATLAFVPSFRNLE